MNRKLDVGLTFAGAILLAAIVWGILVFLCGYQLGDWLRGTVWR